MRYLLISDIHANWEALDAVLKDADGQYDQVVCLGDLVGYGPDPNRVVEWARNHVALAVRGNHDRACTGTCDMEDYSQLARRAALWTHRVLSAENAHYLQQLRPGPIFCQGFDIVHGSPENEDEYLIETGDAAVAFSYTATAITFFGHTHVQGGFQMREQKVRVVNPPEEGPEMGLNADTYYLINPGSVGQPRDGSRRAAYALFTPGSGSVAFHRTAYQFQITQQKIRDAGLPAALADRLSIGH